MITSNFVKVTTDGENCLKLSKAIQDGDYYGVNFIRKHKISINDFRVVEDILRELWKNGKSGCFQKNIANIFEKYGFTVIPDDHNVMFNIE